uniref:Uncharacterized protein n=1 Tax=Ditylenchus dipsaci TaxID=166011 RepID=A0A915E8T1_9BILA
MLQVKNEESDEIDGTTNRVASVTLESDSLSEAPRSFRSKRPRASGSITKCEPSDTKIRMDWEASAILSDIDFSSDHSRSGDNDDADDEQSDWPDYKKSSELGHAVKFGTIYHQLHPPAPLLAPPSTATKSGTLSANVVRRIERLCLTSSKKNSFSVKFTRLLW